MMVLPLYSPKASPWAKGWMRDFTFELCRFVRQVREGAMNHNMVRNSVDESFTAHILVCSRQTISNEEVISSDTLAGVLFFSAGVSDRCQKKA